MGQQQLLLLVLGIVIVGIAIVVGINAYSENSIKSNFDSLLQDGLRIASDAQSWKSKPEVFGGSLDSLKSDPDNFTGVDFVDLAYSEALIKNTANTCYENTNGRYILTGVAGTGTPGTTGVGVMGENEANQNRVLLAVNGILEANVDLVEASSVRGDALLTSGAENSFGTATACP